MDKQSTIAYNHIFQYIESNICTLKCKSLITDFELAPRSAFRSNYPDTLMYTCWFHLSQAVLRKAKKCPGLMEFLNGNKEAKKILYKFMSIALLPAAKIVEAYTLLETEISANEEMKKHFEQFLIYFKSQWLEKVCFAFKFLKCCEKYTHVCKHLFTFNFGRFFFYFGIYSNYLISFY